MIPALTEANVQTAVVGFLNFVLPGVQAFQGQDVRVPEPSDADFIVFTAWNKRRLSTNIWSRADVAFLASVSGTTMTVSSVEYGIILPGATLFGNWIADGTTVLSGPGGIGQYTLSASQMAASGLMATGTINYLQPTEIAFQMDVHGPNSGDNVQVISTLWRDDYGVQLFLASGFDVTPLYADDPAQRPFINAENQYEYRWSVDARVQANIIVSPPQQYAQALKATLIEADVKT